MEYRDALAYIASLAPRGWRLGLDRMQEFARRAGLDDALGTPGGPQFIHVAGTNGKGSVTAYLQSILHESGYRVGSFFSPYVYDPRERIQLGRELIPEKIFAGLTAMLQPVAEEFSETDFDGISEFEFKTAMAFLFYKRLKCEWVALEVGLGGRLDATNIVTPHVSIIVSIGLDHVDILGHSYAAIAREKAGIIKPGVPVMVGELPHEALAVVEEVADANGAPIWRTGREIVIEDMGAVGFTVKTPVATHEGLIPGIKGVAQPLNMALAVAAIDAAGATRTLKGLTDGVERASIPGRFEERRIGGKAVIFDGAHNAEAAEVLAQTLEHYYRGRRGRIVLGMVHGHSAENFLRPLAGWLGAAYVTAIDYARTQMPEDLAAFTRAAGIPTLEFEHASAAFQAALRDCGDDEFVLVTGSFYLVGEVGRTLQ